MNRIRIAIALAALLTANACGGDNNPTDPGGSVVSADGGITATVNGTAWRSAKANDRVTRSGQVYSISALNLPYVLIVTIANVTGPGTISLSLTAGGNAGSNGIISNSVGGWGTAFTGGSGTVTVTTLTANRIVGTFSFDATPGSGGATGTMQVRNGTFDLTF